MASYKPRRTSSSSCDPEREHEPTNILIEQQQQETAAVVPIALEETIPFDQDNDEDKDHTETYENEHDENEEEVVVVSAPLQAEQPASSEQNLDDNDSYNMDVDPEELGYGQFSDSERSSPQPDNELPPLEPVVAEVYRRSSSRLWDDDYSEHMPVVTISPSNEIDDSSEGMTPATTLKQVRDSVTQREVVTVDLEARMVPTADDINSFMEEGDEEADVGHTRTAQFISARTVRSNPNEDVGLRVTLQNESVVISEVKTDGLFRRSPILAGDILMSINSDSCLGMKLPGVLRLLQTATDHVTITAQNERGDGSLVECYVKKPHADAKLGISLLSDDATHRRMRSRRQSRRGPIIASIESEGLFVDSLLNPGDRILSVNGKSVVDTRSAASILSKARSHVTILARTKDRTAAVVTTEPEQGTRSRVFDFYGIPARARRLRSGGEPSRSSTYDSVRIACNVGALVLSVLVVVSPAGSGLYLTSRNWVFAVVTIFALVNMPWQFRRPGSRCSIVQLVCNLLVLAFFMYVLFGSDEELAVGWVCAVYLPLLIMINLPTMFPGGDTPEGDEVEQADELLDERHENGEGLCAL